MDWIKISDKQEVPIGVNVLISWHDGWTTAYLSDDKTAWIGKNTYIRFESVCHYCIVKMPNKDEE